MTTSPYIVRLPIFASVLFSVSACAQSQAGGDGTPAPPRLELLVLVEADGRPTVNGTATDSLGLAAAVLSHIRSVPEGYITFGLAEDASDHSAYVRWIDTIKDVYASERDAYARATFGRLQDQLTESEREQVWRAIPADIRLIEP